jgi:hypothetical protein
MPVRPAAFAFACVLFALTAPVLADDAPKPPNVVLILADDLGWGDVSFNGRTQWRTPNLDRLATQGTVFDRWYTAAVVCAPSRAALMTGKSTIHDGVSRNNDDLPASEVTIAEALKKRGYATGLFGKWHHGKPRAGEKTYVHPMDQGFDEFFGFTDATHAWEKFPEKLWDGRALKASARVTSRSGRSSLLRETPSWIVYLPVSRAARLGAQTTPAVYQRLKTVPCPASRSRWGVFHSVRPLNPTSPQPRSSA